MPLENLSRFNQYKVSERDMQEKLQGNRNGKHRAGSVDCQKTQDEKYNWKGRSTITPSCGISDDVYNVSHARSEKSTAQSSEISTSRSSDTRDVLLHPTNNGLIGVRGCSVKCDAGFQDEMTPSFLSQALK
jgi:hypothetical protein